MNDYNKVVDGSMAEIRDRDAIDGVSVDTLNHPVIIEKWPRIVRWGFMIGAAASLWIILVAAFYLVSQD